MAMEFDDLAVGKRLFVGEGSPIALGLGPTEIRGSGYVEGPVIIGDPSKFPIVAANLMVAQCENDDSPTPIIPGAICGFNHSPYSLAVDGDAAFFQNCTLNGQIEVGTHVLAQGEVISRYGGGFHILSMKRTLIFLTHPKKDGV